MSGSITHVHVEVDARNPGQFFACCGLLELAERFSPGADGWFSGSGFVVACEENIRSLLTCLLEREARPVLELDNGLVVKPIIAPLRVAFSGDESRTILLDGWMRIGRDKGSPTAMGNSPWNFWSGQQTSAGIWNSLRVALKQQLGKLNDSDLPRLFSERVLLSGRFGFDPGAAWDALDAGFSPNAQQMTVASSPAVELLAAVGIQRFRPAMSKDRQSFRYATWRDPLPAPVAACAASGLPITPRLSLFEGQVVSRGQYAALGLSTPI